MQGDNFMKSKLIPISEVADLLKVTQKTIREWEKTGKLLPYDKTEGGHRRYRMSDINKMIPNRVGQSILDEYNSADFNTRTKELDKKYEFMKSKGYVGEETVDNVNLAVLLSNYLSLMSVTHQSEYDEGAEYGIDLIIATWNKLLTRDLVSYQAMEAPTGLIFYTTEKLTHPPHRDVPSDIDLTIESDVIIAKTRLLPKLVSPGPRREVEITILDPETFKPFKKAATFGHGLNKESTIKLNSDNFSKNIDDEIIQDLSTNSKSMGYWDTTDLNFLQPKDETKTIITNEIGIELLKTKLDPGVCAPFNPDGFDNLGNRLKKVGKVGEIDLYFHPEVDKLLFVRKGLGCLNSAYFFCPYIFYNSTPLAMPHDGRVQCGSLIRYGKKLSPMASDYYYHYNF